MLLRELHTSITESINIDYVLTMIDDLVEAGWAHHPAVFKVLDSMGIKSPEDRIMMQGKIRDEFKKRASKRRKENLKKIPASYVI